MGQKSVLWLWGRLATSVAARGRCATAGLFLVFASVLAVPVPAFGQDLGTLHVTASTLAEAGGTADVAVQILGNIGNQQVTLGIGDGTAAGVADFVVSSNDSDVHQVLGSDNSVIGYLVVPGGNYFPSATITSVDDSVADPGETIGFVVFIGGTNSNVNFTLNAGGMEPACGCVTITDDDPLPTVAISALPSAVREDAGATTVRVDWTMSGTALGWSRTLTVSVGDVSGTATLPANDSSASGTVDVRYTPVNDNLYEGDRTVAVSGSAGDVSVTGTTLRIVEDESPPTVTLTSVSPSSLDEDAGRTAVSVGWRMSGTALKEQRTLTVSVGSASKDLMLPARHTGASVNGTVDVSYTPVDSACYSGNRTVSVSGDAGSDIPVTGASLTIVDTDPAPAISLTSVSPPSLDEDAGQRTVSVGWSMSGCLASAETLTVSIGGATGTAAIEANDSSASGTVDVAYTPVNDNLYEGDRTVAVSGSAGDVSVTGTTLTIVEDESPPTVTLTSVSPSSLDEDAGRTAVSVGWRMSGTALKERRTLTVSVGSASKDLMLPARHTGASVNGTVDVSYTPVDSACYSGNRTVSVSGDAGSDIPVTGAYLTIVDTDPAPVISLTSVSPPSLDEDAGQRTVSVGWSMSGCLASAETLTVSIGGATGTAAIEANDSSASGTVDVAYTPVNDNLYEGDRTVAVSGSAGDVSVTDTTLTIVEDEPPPTVTLTSVSPSSLDEDAGRTAVSVGWRMSGTALKEQRMLTVSVGSASEDVMLPARHMGASVNGTVDVSYTPVDRACYSGNWTVSVSGDAGSDIPVTGAYLTIVDTDPAPVISLTSVSPPSLDEDAGQRTVSVGWSMSGCLASAETLTVSIGGATGAAAIEANDSSASGTVDVAYTPVNDNLYEGDRTVAVSGSAGDVSVTGTTLTIVEDESPPTVTLTSVSPSSLDEDAGRTAVSVGWRMSGTALKEQRMLTVSVGSASEDVMLPARHMGASVNGTVDVSYTPVDRACYSGNWTVSVSGDAGSDIPVTGTYLTIVDTDPAPVISLTSVSPPSLDEDAGQRTVSVGWSMSGCLASAETLTVSIGGATGTAAIEANDSSASGTVDVAYTPVNDNLYEGDRTVAVSGSAGDVSVTGTTLTIVEDESPPTVTLTSVSPSSLDEDAGRTAVSVGWRMSGTALKEERTLTVSVGSASEDVMLPARHTGASVNGTVDVSYTPVDSACYSGNRTVSVSGDAGSDIPVTGAYLTIVDTDPAPAISLTSVSPASLDEDAGQRTVSVGWSMSGCLASAETLTVSIGGATGAAAIEANDSSASGTVDVAYTPVNDNLYEGDRTVAVSGSAGDVSVTDTTLTIVEDEPPPTVTLTSVSPSSLDEDAGRTAVSVGWRMSGTALKEQRMLTVSVGSASEDVMLPARHMGASVNGTVDVSYTPVDSACYSGNWTVSVSGDAGSDIPVTGAYLTIVDTDPAPVISLTSVSPPSLDEDAGQRTVSVGWSMSGCLASAETLTVSIGGATGAAAIEANDSSASGTVDVAYTPVNDNLYEGDRTVAVSGSAGDVSVTDTTLTIVEDEPPPTVTLTSVSPSSLDEDAGRTAVSVGWRMSGTALKEQRMLTVSVGSASEDVMLPARHMGASVNGTVDVSYTPVDSACYSGNWTVSVSGDAGSDIPVTGAYLTIVDTDPAPVISLTSVSPPSLDEDAGQRTVSVGWSMSGCLASAETLTVSIGGATGTAAIEANDSSASGTVDVAYTPVNDNLYEGDRTVAVSGSAGDVSVTDTTLTIVEDEPPPTVTLTSVSPSSLDEDAGRTAVSVGWRMSGTALKEQRMLTVSVGSASEDVMLPARHMGASVNGTVDVSYTPVDSACYSGNWTVSVSGDAGSDIPVTGAYLTIVDTDPAPVISLTSVSPPSLDEDAGQRTVSVGWSMSGCLASAETLTVSIGGATGTAAIEANDSSASGTVDVAYTPVNDNLYEGDRTVAVSGSAGDVSVTGTTLTIVEDEPPPTVTLTSVSPSSLDEDAGRTAVSVGWRMSGTALKEQRMLTVSVGSASEDVMLPARHMGASVNGTVDVSYTPVDRACYSGNWTVSVSGDAGSDIPVTGTYLTIVDTDPAPVISLTSVSPPSLDEDAGQRTVSVGWSMSGCLASAETLTVSIGGATGTAAIEANDSSASGTVDVAYTPVNDNLYEGDRTVAVSGSAGDVSVTGTTLTIVEDEPPPTVTLTSVSPSSLDEDAGRTAVSVGWRMSGTALKEQRMLTVSVGSASEDVMLPARHMGASVNGTVDVSYTPVDRACYSGNWTVSVSGDAGSDIPVTGTYLTIVDTDPAPVISLTSVSPPSLDEDAGQRTVSVGWSMSGCLASAETLTVSIGGATGAAAIEANDSSASGTVDVAYTPVNDNLYEGDRTVAVSGSAGDVSVTGTTLTIVEDESPPTVTLTSVSPSSLDEDAGRTAVSVGWRMSGTALKEQRMLTVSVGSASEDVMLPARHMGASVNGTVDVSYTPVDRACYSGNWTVSVSGDAGSDIPVTGTYLTIVDTDPAPVISLTSVSPPSLDEDAGQRTVSVGWSMSGCLASAETLTVSIGGATGAAAIEANDSSASGTVDVAYTPVNDNLYEGDRTVAVSGSAGDVSVTDTTLTIVEDEPPPTVTLTSVSPSSLDEDAGRTAVSVGWRMSGTALKEERTLTVSVGGTSGTANLPPDLTSVSGTVSLSLTPVDSACYSGDRTLPVSGDAGSDIPVTGAYLTIVDTDPAPAISLTSVSPASLDEDAGQRTVSVGWSMSGCLASAETLTVSIGGATGAAAIEANDSNARGTVDVRYTPANDNLYEGDRTVAVSGSAGDVSVTDTTLRIVEDESPLDPTPPMYWESSVAGSSLRMWYDEDLNSTLPDDEANPLTGAYTVTASRSSPEVSAVSISGRTVTLTLSPAVEYGETVTVSYDASSAGSHPVKDVAGNRAVNFTGEAVTNNTPLPQVTVSFDAADFEAEEGEASVVVKVTLSSDPQRDVPITVQATPQKGATAQGEPGADYSGVPAKVMFAPGVTVQTFSVLAIDDQVDDDGERVDLSLGTLPDGVSAGDHSTASVALIDNDPDPEVTLWVSPALINENGGVSTVTASLDHASSEATEVRVSAAPVLPAVAGDFTQSGALLTIAAGATSSTGTVTITANDNSVDAPDKTVTVSATASNTEGLAGNPDDVSLTIQDDEPSPTVTLALSSASVSENGGVSTVTASLSHASSQDTTLTVSGTAVSPAVAGDFEQSGAALTIVAGSLTSTGTVTLTAVDNDVYAPDKTVTVSATVSNTQGLAGNPADVTLTIEEDDPSITVGLSSATHTVSEAGSSVVVTVRLSAAAGGTETVDYATADGTAKAGEDYTSTSGTLTFTSGQLEQTVLVPITEDSVDEDNESFTLRLSNPVNAMPGATASSTVTIEDNDERGVMVTPVSLSVDEGDTVGDVYEVVLNSQPVATAPGGSAVVTVAVTIEDAQDTEVEVSPVSLTFTANDWYTAQTVKVTASHDDDYVDDAATLTHAVSGGDYDSVTAESVEVTVIDDDVMALTVSFDPAALSVDEGETGEVTLKIVASLLPVEAVGYRVFTQDGTAERLVDYTPVVPGFEEAPRAEFKAEPDGSYLYKRIFELRTLEDTAVEEDETFHFDITRLVDRSGGHFSVQVEGDEDGMEVTIADDDLPPPTSVTLSVNPTTVAEDSGATLLTVTGTLDQAAIQDTQVMVALSDDGTVSAADFEPASVTLTVLARQMSGEAEITLMPVNDKVVEDDETVLVDGTAAGLDVTAAAVTISNDDVPVWSLTASSATIEEAGGEVTLTVSAGDVTFPGIQSFDLEVSGTATLDSDYTLASPVTLAVGDSSVETALVALADTVADPDETVIITASRNGTQIGMPVTVTIEEIAAGVCGRTELVRDAIVAAVPDVQVCANVTATHLAGITELAVHDLDLTTLQAGDFAGLSGLEELLLDGSGLTALPGGIFDGLTELTKLNLADNALAGLTAGVFDQLTRLTELSLADNALSSLPGGIFDRLGALTKLKLQDNGLTILPARVFAELSGLQELYLTSNDLSRLSAGDFSGLTALRQLSLSSNQLTELPAGIFDGLGELRGLFLTSNQLSSLRASDFAGLTQLTRLFLANNALTELPAGFFDGKSVLTTLRLQGNTANPLPLEVTLVKDGPGEFKAVAPVGAPYSLELEVSVSRAGTIEGDATMITIDAGALESTPLGVARVEGETDAVTVNIDRLPVLLAGHEGYVLTRDATLPRTILVSADASLSALSLSAGVLDPVFVSGTTEYAASVGASVSRITVTPQTSHASATVNYFDADDMEIVDADTTVDGHQVDLTAGGNTIAVKVTAVDEVTSQTYTVVVTRQATAAVSIAAVASPVTEGTAAAFTLTREGSAQSELTVFVNVRQEGMVLADSDDEAAPIAVTFAVDESVHALAVDTDDDDIDEALSGFPQLAGRVAATLQAGSGYEAVAGKESATIDVADDDVPAWAVEADPIRIGEVGGVATLTVSTGGVVTFKEAQTITLTLSGTATAGTDYTVHGASPTSTPQSYELTLPIGSASVTATFKAIKDSVTEDKEKIHIAVNRGSEALGTVVVRIVEGICGRTPEVHAAIRTELGISDCADVGATDLDGVEELDLANQGIEAFKPGDFAGLTGLTDLNLNNNTLTAVAGVVELPGDLFAGLDALLVLELKQMGMTRLPAEIFSGLTKLTDLNLRGNHLTGLPANVFAGLAKLRTLNLRDNRLSNLPDEVFADLTALMTLNLRLNSLTGVPDGTFAGLSNLNSLLLNQSGGGTLSLSVTLEKVDANEFKAVLPAGAPFDVILPVSANSAGSIDEGAETLTIGKGEVRSATLAVSRGEGETAAVDVQIGELPPIPGTHAGYRLDKPTDALVVLAAEAVLPTLPTLSVADASIAESAGAPVVFTVTLTGSAQGTVTVDHVTADGTALARNELQPNGDYTKVQDTLTFTDGETEKTISVPVFSDEVNEGAETFTLTLSNPIGARIVGGVATGTIENTGPLPQAWLVRFGRTVASHVAEGVEERLTQSESPPPHATFAGLRIPFGDGTVAGQEPTQRLGYPNYGRQSWDPDPRFGHAPYGRSSPGGLQDAPIGSSRGLRSRDLLLGSSFLIHLGRKDADQDARSWTLWGRGMATRFDSREETLALDGEVATYMFGADTAWEKWLAGVALAHSSGDGSYDSSSAGLSERGELESSLTSVHPYVRFTVSERVSAWGVLGYGRGDLTLHRGETATWNTPTSMQMAAAGVRGVLKPAALTGGFELALRSDVLWASTGSAASENDAGRLAASEGEARRVRLILEGSRTVSIGTRTLTPSMELGLRHDAGDAETGTGVEIGGGLRLTDPTLGLTVEVKARGLIAHQDAEYREWGASAALRLNPGASGRGLMLTLTPTWGAPLSGTQRLWSQRDVQNLTAGRDFAPSEGLNAEIGYALDGPKGLGMQTPYAALSLGDAGSRTLRVGWRLAAGPKGNLNIEAMRRQTARNDAPAEHGILLRAAMRW